MGTYWNDYLKWVRIANNSLNTDQTAPLKTGQLEFTLFDHAYLSENFALI